jgi:NAD(P)-dependent dehydrogenase (short-subunit alcohol dehydrogenase family)
MNLSGRTAIVTGGGSGLGLATAHALLVAGVSVSLLDRSEEVTRTAARLEGSAIGVVADVVDPDAVTRALDETEALLGPISIAVNCAGTTIGERTASKRGPHGLDSFSRVIGVNLIGTFNVSRLAAERMLRQESDEAGERGVIVNTASIAAYEGQMGQVAYAASKGGIVAMTLPMARDLAREGVRVVTIAPGLFDTPLLRSLPSEMQEGLHSDVPHPHRLGDPAEYGQLVTMIAQNAYLNGEVIRLDGALRMAAR